MDDTICREWIRAALRARRKAYAPYSRYLVGAALLCEDGTVFTGCNIENASYGATICAERTALFSAVAAGQRHFAALAIVSGPEGADETDLPWPSPCGICRQALREFVNPADFEVILARSEREYRVLTLEQLLPESFGPDYL